MFCKFEIRSGNNWTLLAGNDCGETYEEIRDECEEFAVWDHPIDLHYKCKVYVEVW